MGLKATLALVAVVLLSWAALRALHGRPQRTHHEAPNIGLSDIWSAKELENLIRMVEGYGTIPSTVADQTSQIDNVGEARPLLPNGLCEHPYMVPNRNRTACVFAARLDVGRHYVLGGGRTALKEPYERLVARMLSFNKFLFAHEDTLSSVPEFGALFHSKPYLAAASAVCELGVPSPVTDPFQLGVIIQIPGQVVPMHYDAPYFYTSGRFDIPIWLLVAMQFSGMWEAQRVHQIQGVAYLHDWPADVNNGGAFFHYPHGPGGEWAVFEAKRNRAILLDGSQLVHGTDPFRPDERDILLLERSDANSLVFRGNSRWDVVSGNGTVLGGYATSDLRISLVWRSLCFRTEEERQLYKTGAFGNKLTVDEVLARFERDLVKRGRLAPTAAALPRHELALLILDEYVEYPLSRSALVPYNYCALPRLVPEQWRPLVSSALSWLC